MFVTPCESHSGVTGALQNLKQLAISSTQMITFFLWWSSVKIGILHSDSRYFSVLLKMVVSSFTEISLQVQES